MTGMDKKIGMANLVHLFTKMSSTSSDSERSSPDRCFGGHHHHHQHNQPHHRSPFPWRPPHFTPPHHGHRPHSPPHHGHRPHSPPHHWHRPHSPHHHGVYPPQSYGWHPPPHCTGSYTWASASNGEVPPNAVRAGVDKDGGPVFAGRAFHEGDLLPAKVSPTHGGAFVPWGGREHSKFNYEVLCSNHVGWASGERGEVPPEAICVGQTSHGEKLYMGRVMHDGTMTPGKIQPSHGVLYIPYAGMEISFTNYEVLVLF